MQGFVGVSEYFMLHERARSGQLRPAEREAYLLMREELLRHVPRAPLEVPIALHFAAGCDITARTVDVSRGGCAVRLPAPPAERAFRVTLELAPVGPVTVGVQVVGGVAAAGGMHRVCLAFYGVGRKARVALDDAILDAYHRCAVR